MHVEHGIPLFIGHILYDGVPRIARVIDDDIDTPEGVERSLYQLHWKGRVGHITGNDRGLPPCIANGRGGFFCRCGIKVAHNDQRALGAEQLCRCRAYAAPGTGDYSYFAIKHAHSVCSPIYFLCARTPRAGTSPRPYPTTNGTV